MGDGDSGMTDMGDVGSVSVTGSAPGNGAAAFGGLGEGMPDIGTLGGTFADIFGENSATLGGLSGAEQSALNQDIGFGLQNQEENGLFGKLGKSLAQFGLAKAAPQLAQAMTPLSIAYNGLTGKGSQAGATIANGLTMGLGSLGGLFGAPTIGQSFAAQAPYAPDATTVPNAINGVNNSNGGQTGGGWGNTLGGLASLYGMYSRNKDNDAFTSTLANMYGQNSPYAKQLQQSLARRDAAAGRRSQYGPREVELQARLAQAQASVAPSVLQGQQNSMGNYLGMMQQMGNLYQSGAFNKLAGLFSGPSQYDTVNNFGMTSLGQLPTTQYSMPDIPDISTNPGGW